ncbi:MAG: zinc ribbon domain-containing protein [Paludibacter sp.]|nr:zinc ribbon domain-containing protein [Paludibacter sp.]
MNMYKCPKCNAEFELGTKFCQNCGCNLEKEFIETPTCPKCGKNFPTGTKFCSEDGSKLVSPDKLIPRCVKCGKEYIDGTKFCPEDGGQILAEANRNFSIKNENDFVNKTNDTVADIADNIGYQFATAVKQWHGFVIGWAIIALIINVVTFLRTLSTLNYIIEGFKYIEHWGTMDYIRILAWICPAIIIYGIVKLLRREKSGFTLLVIAAVVAFACNIYFGLIAPAVFGLLSIGIWYAVLQIKKNGITAWSTLE